MDRNNRTITVSRISIGAIRTHLDGSVVYLGLPTKFHVYVGNEIFAESYQSAIDEGILTDEQLLGILAKEGLWSYEDDDKIKQLKEELDQLKVDTYESRFRLQDFQLYKLRIKKKKKELIELLGIKHSFDYATAEGLASLYRLNYLIVSGLKNNKFQEMNIELGDLDGDQLNQLKDAYLSSRLDESVIRELARNEPWRSYWSVSNKANVFDKPLLEWTDEQQSLVIWSKLYDSIRETTEPPSEDVVNDDDAFDGWLILQGRKNKQELAKKNGEMSISKNKKIKDAQEIFIMVGNEKNPLTGQNIQLAQDLDDARRLDEMLNDDKARAIKRERFATLSAVGELKAQQFGDIQRDLKMQINNAYKEKMKGR